MKEEELTMLFEAIEALIEEKISSDHGRDSLPEYIRASALKQDCINMIAFGESLEQSS